MKVPRILCVALVCSSLASVAAEAASYQGAGSSSAMAADSANQVHPNEAGPSSARHTADNHAVTDEDTGKKAERADARRSPRAAPDKSVGSTSGSPGTAASRAHGSAAPQRGITQLARPNADRLRSLLNAQARGRVTRKPARGPFGPGRAAIGGRPAVPAPGGAGQVLRPTRVASRSTAVASGTTARGPTPVASGPGPASLASGLAPLAAGSASVAPRPAPLASNAAVRAGTGPSALTSAIGRGSAIGGPRVAGAGLVGGPTTVRTVHSAMIDGTQVHHPH
ncbi:MAG: hypothetical protein JWO52_43 [Gammaproteobacteria bacterium]|nr:hypothetical protein [Gammaproteobacteria bacterium]